MIRNSKPTEQTGVIHHKAVNNESDETEINVPHSTFRSIKNECNTRVWIFMLNRFKKEQEKFFGIRFFFFMETSSNKIHWNKKFSGIVNDSLAMSDKLFPWKLLMNLEKYDLCGEAA